MEAKELRIGNIIQSTEFKNPFSVDYQNIGFVMLEPDKYEPVGLTTEWLERFGFELDSENRNKISFGLITKSLITQGLYFAYDIYKDKKKKNRFTICDLRMPIGNFQHVHQLQNLYFALTGEELV